MTAEHTNRIHSVSPAGTDVSIGERGTGIRRATNDNNRVDASRDDSRCRIDPRRTSPECNSRT